MIYQGLYYPHNIDFIWHSAGMQGRSAETLRAARELAASAPIDMVQKVPDMELMPAAPIGALARFGRWQELLSQPAPPGGLVYVTGLWRYGRGLAFAATARPAEARAELRELETLTTGVPADRSLGGFFKTADMLKLASTVLAGEIAARGGETEPAVSLLSTATRMQDRHWFTEPPPWYYPVRQSLGAALLQGGRAAEAEAVYREDLRRNPENGWSLFGLAQSLRAQGRTAEAGIVDERFRRAWAQADVTLSASRF